MRPSLSTLTSLPSLAHVLEAFGGEGRDRLACADQTGSLSFGRLVDEARALAGAMTASGVRTGDRVVLVVPSGIQFVRLFWAAQRAGAVVCALNPLAPPAATARRAKSTRPRLVIADDETATLLHRAADDLPLFTAGELALAGGTPPALAAGRDDVAWLQPTSGTSGEARLAVILQRNALDMVRSMYDIDWAGHDAPHAAWVPPWHDLGLVRFVIGAALAGAPVHFVPPSIHTIPKWLQTMARENVAITGAPDFAYRIAAHIGGNDLDLSPLRYALSGGEPLRIDTIRRFESRFGLNGVIHAGYGLAEATLAVSFQRPGEPLVVDERGNVSCGLPAPGVEVRIDGDATGGEILARGPNVFAGYFDEPAATAEVLRDGWLHTGDIGRVDAAGRLYVLGRKRAMLKRGGAMLAPREVEDAAMRTAGVRLAAAVGLVPHESRASETLVLAVEPLHASDDAAGIASGVAAAVRDEIGSSPERILVLAPRSIPMTWNGKIRHSVLRDELEAGVLHEKGRVLFDSGAG